MRQIYVLLVVCGLGLTPAFADDPVPAYVPKAIAPCKLYKTTTGLQVCGYEDFEDYKKVLVLDIEVVHLRLQLKNEQERSAALLKLEELAVIQVDAMARSQTLLKEHSDKLTKQLIELDEKYQNERVKPRWGSPVAWTLAAASTAILAGFVISSVLN